MGYRNIEVNGKIYQYVVGKKNVHIKGTGVKPVNLPREHLGDRVWVPLENGNGYNEYKVTPSHIKDVILRRM